MTISRKATIPAQEVAYLLRHCLGPIRCWSDFLADCLRDRTSIKGLTLKPCAKRHDGRVYRPVYAVDDVRVFIDQVRKTVPEASASARIKQIILTIDRRVGWRAQKFDREGNRVIKAKGHGGVLH